MNPRETISVVAPAGGWPTFSSTIAAPVTPSEAAAARTRIELTPSAVTGGALVNPVAHSAAHPHNRPMRCPQMACLGLAAGWRGVKNSRYAVGPNDGNTND